MPQTDHTAMEGLIFRKSTRSTTNGNCVEVGVGHEHVKIRDSKLSPSPVLTFSHASWAALLADIRAGRLS